MFQSAVTLENISAYLLTFSTHCFCSAGFSDEVANDGGDKDRGIKDGGDINQSPSLMVGLSVCAVLVVVVVVAIVIIIQRRKCLLRRVSDP